MRIARGSPPWARTLKATRNVSLVLASLLAATGAVAAEAPLAQATPTPQPAGTPGDAAPPAETPPSRFRSAEDGWVDVSGWLDEAWGFVPLAAPITEPALGFGGAGALAFIGRPSGKHRGFSRPNVTVVGGLGTENGTWAGFAGDLRQWGDDRVQTFVAVFDASVNLDFYGLGDSSMLASRPLSYNLRPTGGLVQAKLRLGDSRAFVGANYIYSSTDVAFNAPEGTSGLPARSGRSTIGGLTPSLTYDSRDSLFTPARGTYVEASAGLFSDAFGSDDEFQKVAIVAMQFLELHPKFYLGLRGDGAFTFGDAPFYMRPYLSLRGAPLMRYQGEYVSQVEVEGRWQFWRRLSLVGFGGKGLTWNELEGFERKVDITTGGGGVRYELARRYKLHMGLDVAFGPDGPAIYVQFGSAWARP